LHSKSNFVIRASNSGSEIALQIARNLFQYFAADSEIVNIDANISSSAGNVISVGLVGDLPISSAPSCSLWLDGDQGIKIERSDGSQRSFRAQEGLGAIFLRPICQGRLELVVWGFDDAGLRQAARLVPMLTGVGQPEFVVVSRNCAWEGAAGVLAMGSFDNFWKVSEASFISSA